AESTCNNNVLCSGAYSYNNWGKINTYTQQTTDPATNTSENKDYRYYFPSNSADMAQGQTSFAPIIKYDRQQNPQPLETCTYGINGSIRKRYDHPTQNTDYYYFNASGNLKACGTDMQISVYGYNSANTRTYKVNLFNANQWVNGQPQPIQPMVQSAMFYPNTYLNFTQAGEYTKHYYNGTERICSRLGEQQVPVSLENDQELEAYQHDIKQILYNAIGQHLYDDPTDMQEGDLIPLEFLQETGDNNAIFYYHPNHLASTMYVTDAQQSVVQSFLYAPYGDIISEYHPGFNGNVLPNYAFNAKELDEETGMYYYEARYYAPPVFTSRDPMFEKYFWMSPYAYCANNPVKYVDPSGEEVSTHTDENGRVIAVFDDGDNGVYRHGRNADGSSVTEYQITKRHENKGTSAGGTYMGESLHSLSFADQSLYNTNGQIRPMPGMIIDFDSDELTRKANSIIDQSPSLYQYQKNADKKGDWNLKKDIKHGSLLYGKYASPRDAGNFIAGMVAASGGFLREEVAQIGYGAYNLSGNSKFKTALILLNVARVCRRNLIVGLIMLEYVKNGEDFLSQRCIDLGKVYQRNKK
ncbi:MAG: RHS repeat-associated core domain-containing protein, partial [Bacteroidales bacterium]|nr:RHS repeat-associated core domain-containing protein [Bacteroidales bacterium]